MKNSGGMFEGMVGIVLAAAAAVRAPAAAGAAVSGLSIPVRGALVPPFEDSQQTVGFVSAGTVAVLLILAIFIQRRLTTVQTRTMGIVSVLLLLGSLAVYFPF